MRSIITIIILCFNLQAGERYSKDIFVTWELFEADKLASIWLIEKFINSDAEIRIVPRDSEITKGTLFDTPDAYFKRTITKSTFEMLRDYYDVNDDNVDAIAKLIHDIEINKWAIKNYKITSKVEAFVSKLIRSEFADETIIEKSNLFFNSLYKNERSELEKLLK